MEPLRIEIAIHLPGGAPPVHVVSQHEVDREHHVASGLPAPSPAALEAARPHDRDQLVAALESAHSVHHEAIEANKKLTDLLRERTIERDHFKEDSLLWSLVVARFVADEGGELVVRRDEINAFMGRMLEAKVEDGWLTVTLEDRPDASEESRG